jgi:uncharacterized membrane protein YccC
VAKGIPDGEIDSTALRGIAKKRGLILLASAFVLALFPSGILQLLIVIIAAYLGYEDARKWDELNTTTTIVLTILGLTLIVLRTTIPTGIEEHLGAGIMGMLIGFGVYMLAFALTYLFSDHQKAPSEKEVQESDTKSLLMYNLLTFLFSQNFFLNKNLLFNMILKL